MAHNFTEFLGGGKLVFSGISKGKVANTKIPERSFQKSISTIPMVWILSGIAQWTGGFIQKSQINILVAWHLELF